MTETLDSVPISPTAAEELAALVSKATTLSKLALDMTRLCIEIGDGLPAVVKAQVDAAIAELAPVGPQFYRSAAIAPDDLEALFPSGYGDNQPWYVICVGRRPGLYASAADADDQVRGVPNQLRKKKDSHEEALLYYRSQYRIGECTRISEAPPASHVLVQAGSSQSQ
ncbi:hypothetical protein K438DRAFT_1977432 [Mycena galopus ATCC 62051]|nr:hypothetical protein K438DRAFT_1977432 [Mycena galopus ATCC 62051]